MFNAVIMPGQKYLFSDQKTFDFYYALWYTFIRKLNMLSWSSGQDVALSRRNQGFDSPREYQEKLLLKALTFRSSFYYCYIGGVEPERAGA